jgi:CubicO group peptidase (beta-lactamase class C family)
MTKPIISVALMTLFEEGKFKLHDPISKYIHDFKDLKVYVGEKDGKIVTEDLEREITILDLFTHTSGLAGGYYEDDPIDKLYIENFAFDKTKLLSLKEVVQVLSKLPLRFQPGKYFRYGYGIDVLGRLIEVISGCSLDKFLEERVFQPLEMTDTAFFVPEEKMARFTQIYSYSVEEKLQLITTPKVTQRYTRDQKFFSGGGGLVSTINDYFNFILMFLNKGKFKEKRLLYSETVDLITKNHLKNNQTITDMALSRTIVDYLRLHEYGQGLGIRVRIKENNLQSGVGEHGWGGSAHTYYWVDPLNQVIGLFMTQVTIPHPNFDRVSLIPIAYEGLRQK